MIMTHSDDDGLIVPPKVAPTQIVILPVTPKEESRSQVLEACRSLEKQLKSLNFSGSGIRVEIDDRDLRGGEKYWQWVKKGVPLTLEIGPRDLENKSVFVGRRDKGAKREGMNLSELIEKVPDILGNIQQSLFQRALDFREEHTKIIDDKDEFYKFFTPSGKNKSVIHGGFALVHWDRDSKWEEQIKNELKVTIRCIPEDSKEAGVCLFSGNPSPGRVVMAKSY
jgi:prolyl-tRNA synthetase